MAYGHTLTHAVAHASHPHPWYFGMSGSEIGVFIRDARRSIANGNQIENDGLLGTAVCNELGLAMPTESNYIAAIPATVLKSAPLAAHD
jgi:hypothetical protein